MMYGTAHSSANAYEGVDGGGSSTPARVTKGCAQPESGAAFSPSFNQGL
jgi:hypothetical protein